MLLGRCCGCCHRRLVPHQRLLSWHAPQPSKKKSVRMKLGDKLSMYYNEEVSRFGA